MLKAAAKMPGSICSMQTEQLHLKTVDAKVGLRNKLKLRYAHGPRRLAAKEEQKNRGSKEKYWQKLPTNY